MTAQSTTELHRQVTGLAHDHGLMVDVDSIRINEAGLDYRVAFARTEDGQEWVLRIPRRPDVSDKIAAEAAIVGFVARHLSAAVPDWRIHTPRLVAYPELPGSPGLTLDATGQPVWHFDPENRQYARSFGRLLAELHTVGAGAAQRAGIPVQSPAGIRQEWQARLERAAEAFTIARPLLRRWQTWLDDDRLWPDYTVLTHGELYPAHLLLADDGTILSVLDWTTAQVGDPALDFVSHHMLSSPQTFQVTVDTYAEVTGRVPAHLAERCTEILAAGPLTYADFALTSGEPEHASAAAEQLRG